jgi:biotin carboxyl carrier protein
VAAGDTLVVVEAMKMEHPVTAPAGGTVVEVRVVPGQQVVMEETLVILGDVGGSEPPSGLDAGGS